MRREGGRPIPAWTLVMEILKLPGGKGKRDEIIAYANR